jgi:3,4-dihydroxy 2-butanone 4-phosphate synthase/GTP cyclohydrolase II
MAEVTALREGSAARDSGVHSNLARVRDAVRALSAGDPVLVLHGGPSTLPHFLILAAERVTAVSLSDLFQRAHGLIYLALPIERWTDLGVEAVSKESTSILPHFMESIDARDRIGTGVSAEDRARTIQLAIAPETTGADLMRPGHVYALGAQAGGSLTRPGPTEAAVDLTRMTSRTPGAVMCAALTKAGEVASAGRLEASCRRAGIPVVTVNDVIAARWDSEKLIERVVVADLPTSHGGFRAVTFRERISDDLHVALVSHASSDGAGYLVSTHAECLLGSALGGVQCSCRAHLDEALRRTADVGGAVLYTPRPHRVRSANPLASCPRAAVHAHGCVTDERASLRVAAQILRDLGLCRVRWLGTGPPCGKLSSDVQIVGRESYAR